MTISFLVFKININVITHKINIINTIIPQLKNGDDIMSLNDKLSVKIVFKLCDKVEFIY